MVVTSSESARAPAAFGLQSDKPIRVLHLVHWLNRGGIEKWLLDFFQATDRSRFEMDLCCKGPSVGILAPEFQRIGAQVTHHPLGWNHGRFGRRLSGTLTGGNYDILHVQAGIFAGYPAGIGRRAGVEVVTTFHSTVFREEKNTDQAGGRWGPIAGLRANLRSRYGKWSLRGACENSDVVIACSRAVAQSVTGNAGAIAPDKLRVLACGTTKSPGRDPSHRRAKRFELGIPENAPVAIHVGTMREAKNHPALLRVAERIRRAVPGFVLLIAGDGPLRSQVERAVHEAGLERTVMLLGSREDVEQLLEAADLMLFPSKWEGLPVAVIEAQTKGLPVIGSDIPPMHEAIVPGETGLLFGLSRENEMSEAAVALLADESRRVAMGQAAIRFAADRFSIRSIAEQHYQLYRDLVRTKAAKPPKE